MSPRAPAARRGEATASLGDGGPLPGSFHLLWGSALALLVIGLVMMYSVSSAAGLTRPDGDGLFYLRQQGLTALGGMALLLVLARVDYRVWRRAVPLCVSCTVVLLLLVLVPGLGLNAGGATRWLGLGSLSIQPSELAKLAFVAGAAYLLAARRTHRGRVAEYGPILLLGVTLCLVILWQRDLGTAVVLAACLFGLLWVGGLRVPQWAGLAVLGAAGTLVAILAEPYRRTRLLAFLDPGAEPLGAGYQVRQALIAVSRGGVIGVGAGRGVQKFSYLPEAHTDMVYAVLAEEFGLVGMVLVAALYCVFTLSAFHLARRCRDPFGKYLVAGGAVLVFSQATINMGGVLGALPLTGVPLPFISFGRNNLLVVMAAVGIILSVARFGPAVSSAVGREVAEEDTPPLRSQAVRSDRVRLESANVLHIDSRRGHGGARRAGSRHS